MMIINPFIYGTGGGPPPPTGSEVVFMAASPTSQQVADFQGDGIQFMIPGDGSADDQ